MKLHDLARAGVITDDPELRHPVYDSMDNITQLCATLAASRLLGCAQAGYDVLNARRIIDFGTGSAASAFSLGLLAERSHGSVDSLEIDTNLDWAEKIKRSGLEQELPVSVHIVDGLEWISNRAQEGKRYDLITGCWFGPDYTGDLTKGLVSASRQALASSGLLIIYSDIATMDSVKRACKEESVDYSPIHDSSRPFEPDMVVIRQGVASHGN